MYPASWLGPRSRPGGSAARLVSLLAALTVLYGALIAFVDMAPGPGRFVSVGSTPAWECRDLGEQVFGMGGGKQLGGGAHIECRFAADDPRIPQRIAFGLGVLALATTLFAAASRLTRARPALA